MSTRLHAAISHKTVIFILTVVRTRNLRTVLQLNANISFPYISTWPTTLVLLITHTCKAERRSIAVFPGWKWTHYANVLMPLYPESVPNLRSCVYLLSKPFLGSEWVIFLGVSHSARQSTELLDRSHLITHKLVAVCVGSRDNSLTLPVLHHCLKSEFKLTA